MLKRATISIGLLSGLFILVIFGLVYQVQAQTGEQDWSIPTNLSQSGAASNPQTVVSVNSILHILWQDDFSGFIYSQGDGETLSPPVPLDFPFGREITLLNGGRTRVDYPPKLVADTNNRIHAFWIDDDSSLFYSRVVAEEFGTFASWTGQTQLAEAALDYDIAVGLNDLLHLVYIRPVSSEEFPAGVYYRNSTDGGAVWSTPVLLYASPYFRSLSRQQARIQIQATAGGAIIVAFDNLPEDRVFIIRSGDGGGTWDGPTEIDNRRNDDLDTAVGPSKISVVDDGSIIHLFWQAGHEAFLCAQYHQWSADGGVTWQPPTRILTEFEGCSQDNDYVVVPGGLVLVSVFESGVYTQFWDGSRWGELERHAILSGFSNPSTFRLVDLGCRNMNVLNGRVYVIGCDTSSNNDVWRLSTDINNLTQSDNVSESVWREQEVVVTLGDGFAGSSPLLVADADGRIHAFWSQKEGAISTINYAVSDGAGWSGSIDVLTSPGNGSQSEDVAAVFHPDGQLMAVWDNGPAGEIYFSRVDASLASSAVEWFASEVLPALHTRAGSPDIAIDPTGRIFVAYALQLNEERGIYLVWSDDAGESWSDPRQVFDGVAEEWEAVDDPRLAITGDGLVHVVWSQKTLPPANTPLVSAYAASIDGGDSWSSFAELPFADVPPVWSEISGSGFQTLHRVWQEDFENGSNYWYQISNDDGLTWEQPVRISDRNNPIGQADLVVDGGGRLHLVQLTGLNFSGQAVENASPAVQHWTLTEDGWTQRESIPVQPGVLSNVSGIAGVVSANGNLALLFSGLNLNVETGRLQPGYLTSSRSLSAVITPPTPVATSSISSTETITGSEITVDLTPTPVSETVIQPTPTVFFPQEQGGNGIPLPILGSVDPVVVVIPLGLIIFVLVFVSVRFVRSNRG